MLGKFIFESSELKGDDKFRLLFDLFCTEHTPESLELKRPIDQTLHQDRHMTPEKTNKNRHGLNTIALLKKFLYLFRNAYRY